MKRAIAAAIALSFAACGGSDAPAPPQPPGTLPPRGASAPGTGAGANEAPVIESAEIEPASPGAVDPLTVVVRASDPERERLSTRVEWYKNGELVPDLTDTIVDAGTFARGDRVHAIVYVADATHEVSRQTSEISIGNSAPRIRAVSITPAQPTAVDLLEAQPNVTDADGDSIEVSYRWYKNGELIPAATSSRLPAGAAHRGDKVSVEASASDGSDTGPWVSSPLIVLANAKPAITTQPGYEMGPTGVYSYEIGAKDPDGDQPLRYELVQGPPGMTVDEATGAVTWTVPQDAKGNNPIEVAVSDSYGGRTTQRWVLSVDWNQPPASASPAAETNDERAKQASDEEKPPAKRETAKPKDAKAPKAAKAKPRSEDDTDQDQDQEQGEETEEEEF